VPHDAWQDKALKTDDPRLFVQGALALLVAEPDHSTAEAILVRVESLLASYLSDADFLDLLRVTEIALERGQIAGGEVATLRKKLANEYPSKDRTLNR
jgi:hypothetical protein